VLGVPGGLTPYGNKPLELLPVRYKKTEIGLFLKEERI
jgi:hypothetical protein